MTGITQTGGDLLIVAEPWSDLKVLTYSVEVGKPPMTVNGELPVELHLLNESRDDLLAQIAALKMFMAGKGCSHLVVSTRGPIERIGKHYAYCISVTGVRAPTAFSPKDEVIRIKEIPKIVDILLETSV